MNIQSLGFRTDLIFPRFEGEIVDRGDYVTVRTPSNPGFYWGNFLLFADAPQTGDLERWREIFAREIGTPPTIEHVAIGWDTTTGERGELQPFLKAGFEFEEFTVLTASAVHRSPKHSEAVEVRLIVEDWEWVAVIEEQVMCREPQFSEAGYRLFKEREFRRYRAMAEAGLGNWFGAFIGGELAGDLGVFVEDGAGRFQHVVTHPDFRRRGVAGTLVYRAGMYALAELGAQTLVMVAEAGGHAVGVYESVGFRQTERQVVLTGHPEAGS